MGGSWLITEEGRGWKKEGRKEGKGRSDGIVFSGILVYVCVYGGFVPADNVD